MGIRIDGKETATAVKVLTNRMGENWIGHFILEVSRNSPYRIRLDILENKKRVAGFQLVEQVNCCGVIVSTRTYVYNSVKDMGYAQEMMELKIALAKEFGYSAMLATVVMKNEAEVHILEKFGWKCGETFVNTRSKNELGIFTLLLNKGE